MRAHKTGHQIADTVSDLMGELPDGDYKIAYGILRHKLFDGSHDKWFEIDKGYWGAGHYDGNYRVSFRGTQLRYDPHAPRKPHGLTLEPWKQQSGPALIAPPTSHVCDFFGIDYSSWLMNAISVADGPYTIRHKGDSRPLSFDGIRQVITFNSTVGFEALRYGIPVIGDPEHSTIGSYTSEIKTIDKYCREELFSFCAGHQFKLGNKAGICRVIEHYMSI